MDLLEAIREGNTSKAQKLLDEGSDPNSEAEGFTSMLQAAAWYSDEDIVRLLVAKGADVNRVHERYGTALEAAADQNSTDIVRYLLAQGADVHHQGGMFINALRSAIHSGGQEIVEMLLDNGMDVDIPCGRLGKAIHYAAAFGHTRLVEILIANNAKVNEKTTKCEVPLEQDTESELIKVRQNAIGKWLESTAPLGEDRYGLRATIDSGDPSTMRILIQAAANLNLPALNARTSAIENHYIDKIYPLIALVDKGGTPLHYATTPHSTATASILIEKGANVDALDGDGKTPLHYASEDHNVAIARLLIENGANLNTLDSDQTAPLHHAVKKNNLAVARLLIEKGAVVDLPYNDGRSLLRTAVEHQYRDMTDVLVKSGADLNSDRGLLPAALFHLPQSVFNNVHAFDIDVDDLCTQFEAGRLRGRDLFHLISKREDITSWKAALDCQNQVMIYLNAQSIVETLRDAGISLEDQLEAARQSKREDIVKLLTRKSLHLKVPYNIAFVSTIPYRFAVCLGLVEAPVPPGHLRLCWTCVR